MAQCDPIPTSTAFETEFDTAIVGTTTLFTTATRTTLIRDSFPSTICVIEGPSGNCLAFTVSTISYTITSTLFSSRPTATEPIIETETIVRPVQTFFAPCIETTTIFQPQPTPTDSGTWSPSVTTINGSVSVTSIFITVSPTSTSEPSTGSSTNVGAIVGGTLGGLAGIAVIIFILLSLWRSNRRMKQELDDRERKDAVIEGTNFTPDPFPYHSSGSPDTTSGGLDSAFGHAVMRPPSVPAAGFLPIASLYSAGYEEDQERQRISGYTASDAYQGVAYPPDSDPSSSSHRHQSSVSRPGLPTLHTGESLLTAGHGLDAAAIPIARRMTPAASAKAREARLERRSSAGDMAPHPNYAAGNVYGTFPRNRISAPIPGNFMVTNMTDADHDHDTAGGVHPPPSAWVPPPPAYSPSVATFASSDSENASQAPRDQSVDRARSPSRQSSR